jgi:hypothetical protein
MIVIDCHLSKVKRPDQVVRLLRFKTFTVQTGLVDALQATVAVLAIHLAKYLSGVGHPSDCLDVLDALLPETRHELSLLEPAVLRANLFLRVMSDYESVPMDADFSLSVSRGACFVVKILTTWFVRC